MTYLSNNEWNKAFNYFTNSPFNFMKIGVHHEFQ